MAETVDQVVTGTALDWLDELKLRENDSHESRWRERGKKIVKRFRGDDRNDDDVTARFNILWSNIETLFPAI